MQNMLYFWDKNRQIGSSEAKFSTKQINQNVLEMYLH